MTYVNWSTPHTTLENDLATRAALVTKADILRLFLTAPLQTLRALWAEQKKFNELMQLAQADDAQLADIGVNRGDVHQALRQPTARTAAYVLMHCKNENIVN